AGVARAIGDAAHFLEDFAIEAAEEERAGLGAEAAPSGGVGAKIGGAAFQILGNFARHEIAMLVAALVGFAFDVEIDPSGGGVAPGGSKGLDGLAGGPDI